MSVRLILDLRKGSNDKWKFCFWNCRIFIVLESVVSDACLREYSLNIKHLW